MAQDLRNLFEKDAHTQKAKMSEGHETRFLDKLEKALPEENKSRGFSFLNIAASLIVLISLTFGSYKYLSGPNIDSSDDTPIAELPEKTMGSYSPELKKVEDYYLASINLELSKVQLTPENKELVDGYIERLKELNDEYDNLTIELNENGPNEETLDALINNLKFRLNLVTRLKEKLQEFNEAPFTEESI